MTDKDIVDRPRHDYSQRQAPRLPKIDEVALMSAARAHDHYIGSGTVGAMNAERNTREIISVYLAALQQGDGE